MANKVKINNIVYMSNWFLYDTLTFSEYRRWIVDQRKIFTCERIHVNTHTIKMILL